MKSVIDLDGVSPDALFDRFVLDFKGSLKKRGLEFTTGEDGRIDEGLIRVGRVARWNPPSLIELDWRPGAVWGSKGTSKLRIQFVPSPGGTRVVFESDAPEDLIEDRGLLLADWFIDEVIAPATKSLSPETFSAWLTDRRARRPSGEAAKAKYRDPTHHRPNFKAILRALKLTPDDNLLEVGCGGGAFLADALRSGCRASAVDHSPDMVEVAKDANAAAVSEGRLVVRVAEADSLPFRDGEFTCAVCTGVFGLLDAPSVAMAEMFRVLGRGGRLAVFTASEELRGTEAVSEPIASHVNFFKDGELVEMAKEAGFTEARVERPDLGPFAREAGLSDELVQTFSGPRQGQLLFAVKA